MIEVYIIRIILLVSAILGLWKFIHSIRIGKKVDSLSYLFIFLGLGTILTSMYIPGGFEGMALGGIGLLVAVFGGFWTLGNILSNKNKDLKS
jgi:hypothetical protein